MHAGDHDARTTMRVLGALCVLGTGAVHVYENVVEHYEAIRVIGVLFWLNAASALAIGAALLVPLGRLRRSGRPAEVLAALGGILLAAGSIAGLLISEATTLFGFHESGYRSAIVLALLLEAAAIVLLSALLATGLAARRPTPHHTGGGLLTSPTVALPTALAAALLVWAAWATWLHSDAAGSSSAGMSAHVAAGSGPAASVSTRRTGALGTFLVDAHGRPLYLFEQDRRGSGRSSCSGACAAVWPPLTTSGAPVARHGAIAARLSILRRADRGLQVAYDGRPLYTYEGDSPGGPPTGQGLDQFGAKWFVVAPSGQKVARSPSTSREVVIQPSAVIGVPDG